MRGLGARVDDVAGIMYQALVRGLGARVDDVAGIMY
jgi:hypothetical protein